MEDSIGKPKTSKNFGELLKTFETAEPERKPKPKAEKPDLKTQILKRFPKLTEEQYNLFLLIKDNTDKAVRQTVRNKGSKGYIKSLVSRSKSRFCYDGFDLDLTYITPKIIAMGFPSTSIEGIYRNNMEDVKRFFEKRHKNSYKVYNLCGEKTYPKGTFYKQSYYPFPDHEPPPLNLLIPFCEDAKAFLEENEKNVVAIHCKAGKGRTGTFVCALMIYINLFKTADEALAYYGIMRVGDGRGVTIPSQIRYVNYFAEMLDKNIDIKVNQKKIIIRKIKLSNAPGFSRVGWSSYLTFDIDNGENHSYKYYDYIKKKFELAEVDTKADCTFRIGLNKVADLSCDLNVKAHKDIPTFSFKTSQINTENNEIYLSKFNDIVLINSEKDDDKTIIIIVSVVCSVVGAGLIGVGIFFLVRKLKSSKKDRVVETYNNDDSNKRNLQTNKIFQNKEGETAERVIQFGNK